MKFDNLSFVFALLPYVIASNASAGQMLPLREGEYQSGACEDSQYRQNAIGIYTLTDGKKPTEQSIFPRVENIDGYCKVGRIKISKNVYSGSTRCESGNKHDPSTAVYKFSYTIVDNSTFVSKGTTYRWCAPHR